MRGFRATGVEVQGGFGEKAKSDVKGFHMLRILLLAFGLIFAQPLVDQRGGASGAELSLESRFWDSLQLSKLLPILHDEAMAEARTMQDTMFQKGGDGHWLDVVGRLHEPQRLEQLLRESVEETLRTASASQIDEALEFYRTDLGRRMIMLENKTRRDMLDDITEEAAFAAFAEAASYQKPRVAQIKRLIEAADLIEQNVVGGMNAALAFSKGFQSGDGYQTPMTEAQILDEIWKQEPMIRAEALGWLEAFLYRAYAPLSDQELEKYIDFANSPAGQALGQVLFTSFDSLFAQTSREMGIAAARQLKGRAL